MCKKILLEFDDKLYKILIERLPWLGYNSEIDFIHDAIQYRLEILLQLASPVQSSHELQTPQTAVCSHT